MSNKSIKELRNLTKDELNVKLRGLESDWFQAKMKSVTGQLENTAQLWKLRKNISRVKMLLSVSTK